MIKNPIESTTALIISKVLTSFATFVLIHHDLTQKQKDLFIDILIQYTDRDPVLSAEFIKDLEFQTREVVNKL